MKEICVDELSFNPMQLIGEQWLLVAAGNKDSYNAMTASWGHMGSMWALPDRSYKQFRGLPSVVIYLRPQRYTKEFIDAQPYFSLSVVSDEYKRAKMLLGSKSGRDSNKMQDCGLTPVFSDETVYFKEAETVFICRKLYHAPLLEKGFVDPDLVPTNYPKKDFHEMYVAEIVKTLVVE